MNESLHVAFFNRSYYPDLSATGQLLTELCEELRRDHGCRVSVVAGVPLLPVAGNGGPPARGWLVQREVHGGVDVLRARGTRFSKRRFAGRFSNYVSYFLSACWAGQRLQRPDVVVSLTDPPIIGLAGWLAARRFQAPFVMAYKDVFPEVARLLEDFDSRLVESVLQAVNRFLARRADRVAALGSTMRRRLIEGKGADPARTVIIPDWTDCQAIRPFRKDNGFAREHGLDDKFVLMHSGNIGLSQGLERIVEAARELERHPDIRLVFVGEGVKKPELREKVQRMGVNNVLFLPFQPRERLVESFAAADVFLISLTKGLAGYIVPCKLYGILAAGRPYVAAVEPESEVAELSRRWNCGLLAEAEDAASVAAAVLRLYRDRELAAAMGERARDASLEFDRPRQVQAYYRLFQELHGTAAGPPPLSKRLLDVGLSSLGLLSSAPVWLLAALAIKLEDGGPVLHAQQRVGRGGRPFRSWKFRSMKEEADRGGGGEAGLRARPPRHPGGPTVAENGPGRAAAALEHPAGGHELRGPARPAPVGGRGERGRGAAAAGGDPRLPPAAPGDPRADRHRPDLRSAGPAPPPEVPPGHALHPAAQPLAGREADPRVLLDHFSGALGIAGEEAVRGDANHCPGLPNSAILPPVIPRLECKPETGGVPATASHWWRWVGLRISGKGESGRSLERAAPALAHARNDRPGRYTERRGPYGRPWEGSES